MTTCQMEYKYLAHLTGEADYYNRVRLMVFLNRHAFSHPVGRTHNGRHGQIPGQKWSLSHCMVRQRRKAC